MSNSPTKKPHGGKRSGAGRKPSLSQEEQRRAGHLYYELYRNKALERAGKTAFEEEWAEIKKYNVRLSDLNQKFKELPTEEKIKQSREYHQKKDNLRKKLYLSRIFSDNGHAEMQEDETDVVGGLLICSARGRYWPEHEELQQELWAKVAVQMTNELGRKISPTAIKEAVIFHRKELKVEDQDDAIWIERQRILNLLIYKLEFQAD